MNMQPVMLEEDCQAVTVQVKLSRFSAAIGILHYPNTGTAQIEEGWFLISFVNTKHVKNCITFFMLTQALYGKIDKKIFLHLLLS